MTRRSLFKLFGAGAAMLGAGVTVAPARRYGPMTIERHRWLCQHGVHLHLWHEGRDVSRRCTFADDRGDGRAELLLHNAAGKSYLRMVDPGEYGTYPGEMEVAKEFVYGVTFREGEPF